ncbi:Chromosome-partitioning protein Spo0J [Brevundimonas sp. SH203]|uniref:ParB/RepB/Spo0J family partition protein n=1 Tax=Brevundimonas sp. SH203 TaxID=345167 RepID=UPI0009CCC49A|nr:ParB N-terminal domain-containing protein [Brevundimonas sp. SH203]GAW42435.1 Chromosome-partitioning protein Spo0J [Brevundimonas sp. SH203]
MTAELNTVVKLPLSQTYIAGENVRAETAHDADKIALLAGSIRHFGRLLEPLKAYIDADGRAAVWDGGRRWTALKLIEAEADGVGAVIVEAVDVFVTSQEDASAASLATFVREDQHPADEFLAYNAKFDEGMSAEQIAAAFAVSPKTVTQLLRFRTLSPRVLEAFRSGRFDLDVAYAFTLTTDHDKQHALLDAQPGDKPFYAHHIKSALTKGAVTANHKWARFIGRDAYAAAGGTFVQDLFSHHQADEQWSDGDLVHELAQGKLREMENGFLAEGWSKMIVAEYSWGWQDGYEVMKPEGEGKKNKPKPFTAEQMAQGIVFLVPQHGADFEVKKGYRKLGKKVDVNAPLPLAKREPALYGWGHKGHHVMTQVATEATRVALVYQPDVAMIAMATQLAWATLRKDRWGRPERDGLPSRLLPETRHGKTPEVKVKGQDLVGEEVDAWSKRLPEGRVAFCDAIAALTVEERQSLMALCFALTLDADEEKIESRNADRWTHLGWMANKAGVVIEQAWTPDWNFINGGSKDALLDVIATVGNSSPGAGAKKADLSDIVAHNARELGWRPQLLATFTEVAAPEPVSAEADDDAVDQDEDRDAADEAEYLGWIEAALIETHGLADVDAKAVALRALIDERAQANGAEVGDEHYNWTRADAAMSATDYLTANPTASADDED